MRSSSSLFLAFSLSAAAFAGACGSAPPAAPVEPDSRTTTIPPAGQGQETPPPGTPTGTASASATPPPATPPTGTGTGIGKNVPIQASAMLDRLTALGLDAKNLPAFAKLTPEQKKKVMPLFKQSLGYSECTGCHVEGDFKKSTKKMKIAHAMWDHFVVDLRRDGGEPLFCDSCHVGKEEPIDKSDKDALKKFMATEYVDKLDRKDGKPHDCKTCHGDKVELDIIGKLWNIPG